MKRYPGQTIATIDSFRNSGWQEVLASTGRYDYSSMWQALSSAARSAIATGHEREGKSLWLLADACSMMLTPSSLNEPFKAFLVAGSKRSSLPKDFEESDIELFAEFAEEVNHPALRARLADLAWLLSSPRNPKLALLAVDAYRQCPLDTETWIRGGRECWQRAISLTRSLRAGAGDRLVQIESALVGAFERASWEDGNFALWLSDTLSRHRLGHAKSQLVATKLEKVAHAFSNEGDLHRSREYFDGASKWFRRNGDVAKAAEMTVFVAESWAKEAAAVSSSDHPSNMVAASSYEKAIQAYRAIPRGERNTHRVDQRIEELHHRLRDAGAKSLDELGEISSPAVDISEIVETSRNTVRGKSTAEAIAAFSEIHRGAKAEKLRESSERALREFPIQALISATHISRDGRVVARKPGMGLGDLNSDEYKTALWAEMVKHYGIEVSFVVHGGIWPAFEVLRLEHRLRADDFIALSHRSPIVPPGREQLMGRGLFAGYDDDFTVALHLLVPQIEHMVRWHLQRIAVRTSTLSSDGIENESGLSTLMEIPEATQVLGNDLAFEIKALFCDAFGPNLRNELAHGLLTEQDCQSTYAIYAWWLCIRIVVNAYWNAVRKGQAPASEV